MDNNFIDNAVNKKENLDDFPYKVEFIQMAFILNNIVERVMNLAQPFPEIVLGPYTFTDKTEENKKELGPNIFQFIIESENGKSLIINSSEDLWAIMASNPLIVKVPDDLDVQAGWSYTDKDGFFLV